MRQAVIGVVQSDGAILTASAPDGPDVRKTLANHYADRLRATMLVSLGAIATLGATPSNCTMPRNAPEPTLMTRAAFERLASGGTSGFHLFERGRWSSWADEALAGPTFSYEVE